MTPSLPCGYCGRIDDLEQVTPRGILLDQLIQWECPCGNTRSVEISFRVPSDLVRRAMAADEMAGRVRSKPSTGILAVLALILAIPAMPPDRDVPEDRPDVAEANWYRTPPRPSPGEVNWTRRMIEAEIERRK